MSESRKAINPADILGKWGLVGECGGWAAWNEPEEKPYSRFAAEALLFDTEEEAEAEALCTEVAEQVTDLYRKR